MILLLLSWSLYFLLHSLLAATSSKNWFKKTFPLIPFHYYRVGYNLLSIIGLVLLLLYHFKTPSQPFLNCSAFGVLAGKILLLTSLAIMLLAGFNYNLKSFFGFKDDKAGVLKTNNLNRFVRHPLYSATTLFFLAILIRWPLYKNLFVFIIYLVYLYIGMLLEEKKLIALYGADYLQYRSKVKKIIPGIW